MQDHLGELPIPDQAASDPKAIELVRIWPGNGKQRVAMATGLWDDAANWGIMLVDLMEHIAIAYEQTGGLERSQTIARITALILNTQLQYKKQHDTAKHKDTSSFAFFDETTSQ